MGLFSSLFGPPSPQRFARLFLDELRRCGCNEELEYDEVDFSLRSATSKKRHPVYNLGNFYAEYCQLPRLERKRHLRRAIAACLSTQQELPDEYAHARHDLRLKLWSRSAIEKIILQQKIDGEEKGVDFVLEHVGEHLSTSIVFDFPNAVRAVGRENIENWGVTVYEAMEDARRNLMEDNFAFAAIGDSLYASVTGDSYDSSRLLLLDLVRNLAVEGQHVAMVPNRDSLLITGSEDDEGLEMLISLAEKAAEEPRPMLFMPLRLDGENWVDWMPPKTHPQYDRFRLLETKYLFGEYEEQKALLDELHERNGTAIFVASYSAAEKEDGRVFSYCVWSKGVDSLLPKTQKVMFFEEGKGVVASAAWDDVVETAGDLMEQTDEYPPRFRVRSFPTDEQMSAIGNDDK